MGYNIEGSRTPEEIAESRRKLNETAPTPAEKLVLMFAFTKTTCEACGGEITDDQETMDYQDGIREHVKCPDPA